MRTSSKTPPYISIVIANFNSEDFIANCLNSILQEKKTNYEVVVVDDCSTDTSPEMIQSYTKKYPHISLISLKRNVGAAKIRNIGAAKSRGEMLFFLDCDTTVQKGWFQEIISFFLTHPDAGLAQAKILRMNTNAYDYAGDLINSLGFLSERARGAPDTGQFDKIDPIFSLKGAAMITRKSIFQKIGGFDADYGYYWEEPDFAWRVWLAGYRVFFLPKVTVYHEYVTQKKDFHYYAKNDIIYKSARNAITTQLKNVGIKKLFLMVPVHILAWNLLAIALFFKGDIWKSYSIFKGILWNIAHPRLIAMKRTHIQTTRKISDHDLFRIVGKEEPLNYYVLKGVSYILGKPY